MEYRSLNRILLHGLVLCLPFYRYLEITLPGMGLSVCDLALLAGLGLFSYRLLSTGKLKPWPGGWFGGGCALLLLCSMVSTLLAGSRTVAAVFMFSLVLKLVLLLLVYDSCRSIEDIREVCVRYVVVCGVGSLFTIGAAFGKMSSAGLETVGGLFSARNEMTFYMVPAFVLATALYLSGGKTRLLVGVCALCIFFSIFLSRGRTGLMLSVLGAGLLLLGGMVGSRGSRKIGGVATMGAAMVVLILAFRIFMPGAYESLAGRYISSISEESQEERGSVFIRLVVLAEAEKLFRDNPWLGIGGNNFKEKSRDFDLLAPFGIKEIQPHNTYVGALVELGTFGLISFLVTLLSGFGALGSYKSLDGPEKILARGVLIAYALMLVNIAFFDAANRYGLWLFLGLMLSIRRNRIPRTEEADFANERLATV